ncbi:MAG TPA: thiamine phosphate synthase, partial [Acidimicrobiales bacterium]
MTAPDLSLYLVTDTAIAQAAGHTVPEVVTAAVTGGVTTVQVRAKNAPAADFLALVGEVARVLPSHVTLVVNDRVDVFLAARDLGWQVDGVHVGQDDLPVEQVRHLI